LLLPESADESPKTRMDEKLGLGRGSLLTTTRVQTCIKMIRWTVSAIAITCFPTNTVTYIYIWLYMLHILNLFYTVFWKVH